MSFKKTNAPANTPRTLEFRLLLDCLRGPEGALPVELIQSDLNWNLFLQTAQRHAVRPLVYRALANHPSVLGPAREVLESDFRQNALRSVALAAEPKWAGVTGRDLYLRAANAENNKATTRRHESARVGEVDSRLLLFSISFHFDAGLPVSGLRESQRVGAACSWQLWLNENREGLPR